MAARSRTDETNGKLGELRPVAAIRKTNGWSLGSDAIAQETLNLRRGFGECDRLRVRIRRGHEKMESAYEDYQAGRQKNSKNAQDTFDGHGVGSGGHRKKESAADKGKSGVRRDRTALVGRLGGDVFGRNNLPVSCPQVCSQQKRPPR